MDAETHNDLTFEECLKLYRDDPWKLEMQAQGIAYHGWEKLLDIKSDNISDEDIREWWKNDEIRLRDIKLKGLLDTITNGWYQEIKNCKRKQKEAVEKEDYQHAEYYKNAWHHYEYCYHLIKDAKRMAGGYAPTHRRNL